MSAFIEKIGVNGDILLMCKDTPVYNIALIVDCAQKTSSRIGWMQKIPWGGIFLARTWGLMHRYGIIPSALRGEFANSILKTMQCLTVGIAYMLPGNKPINSFLAIMAWNWL